jgi:hypothetical protein
MKNVVFWDIKTLFVLHRRNKKPCSYFTGETLLLRYRVQPVNAM